MIILRRFVIVGTRAMAKGKLPLNDMAGGAEEWMSCQGPDGINSNQSWNQKRR